MAVNFVRLAVVNYKQNIEHLLSALPAGILSVQIIALEDRHVSLFAPVQDQPRLVVGVFRITLQIGGWGRVKKVGEKEIFVNKID